MSFSPFPLYALADDDIAPSLTPTVSSGTPDPTYGNVANLTDGSLGSPFKFDSTSGSLDWDLGTATQLGLLWLWHTNLSGATVEWIVSASPSFTSPTIVPVTLQPQDIDGYWPSVYADLSAVTPQRYLRLSIAGNASNVIIGELTIDVAKRQFLHGYKVGLSRPSKHYGVQLETITGMRMNYDFGVRESQFQKMTVITSRAVGLPALEAMWRSARGKYRLWPIAIDPSVNNVGHLVNFDMDALAPVGLSRSAIQVEIALREASRGIPWTA
jgi:hypothetical protein